MALGNTIAAPALLNRIKKNKQAAAKAAQAELDALDKELEGKEPNDIDEDTQRKRNKLRKRAGTNELTLAYLGASLLTAEHNYAEALTEYAKAEQIQIHNRPSLFQAQGECHLALRQWREAAQRFNKALEIDPVNPNASLGRCRALLGQRQWQAALEHGLESVSLVYHQPLRRLLAQHPDEISCLSVGYAAALKAPTQNAAWMGDLLGAGSDMDAMINAVASELRSQRAEAVR